MLKIIDEIFVGLILSPKHPRVYQVDNISNSTSIAISITLHHILKPVSSNIYYVFGNSHVQVRNAKSKIYFPQINLREIKLYA